MGIRLGLGAGLGRGSGRLRTQQEGWGQRLHWEGGVVGTMGQKGGGPRAQPGAGGRGDATSGVGTAWGTSGPEEVGLPGRVWDPLTAQQSRDVSVSVRAVATNISCDAHLHRETVSLLRTKSLKWIPQNHKLASGRASSVQSLSYVQLFATPWTVARQASLSITNSRSLPKLMSIESVIPSNHLILCHPLLLLPLIFPSIRVFPKESVLRIRWPKDWSFSLNISQDSSKPLNPRLFPKPHERLVSSAHRERELMPMSGQGGGQRLLSMD